MKYLTTLTLFLTSFLLLSQTNNGTFKVRKIKPNNPEIYQSKVEFAKQIDTDLDKTPDFPGGDSALFQFINDNIILPPIIKNDTTFSEETVYIQFYIDTTGLIKNVIPYRSEKKGNPILIDEAIRIVEMMPKWIPGTKNGKKVMVGYMLPFKFKLDK
jgi:protein TonB